MQDRQKIMTRALLALAVAGILIVVVRHQLQAGENAAWANLAKARSAGFTVDALENARDQVRGSDAEPWCAFYLATELYSSDTDLDRAEQVAQETLERFGDHATAPMFQDLLDALASYRSAG